jgi:heterotetrameric sarcosine oxidase gamma subunit
VPELAPLTALGEAEPRRRQFGALALTEIVSLGLASLAVHRDGPAPAIRGLLLPGPGAWAEHAELAAFWTGPGQWMLEIRDGADADLERDLKAADTEAAITTQTDGWLVVEIASAAGPGALERVLEKLVNLDLNRFGPGSATRTHLHHMSVFVVRRSPAIVAVFGMRSMADSLWHALETAVSRAAAAKPSGPV